jgi:hypothetical protein
MKEGAVRWVAAGLNSVHHMVCFFSLTPGIKYARAVLNKNWGTQKEKKIEKETASPYKGHARLHPLPAANGSTTCVI